MLIVVTHSFVTEAYFKFQFLNFLNENRRFYPDFRFSQPLEKMSYADLLAGAFEIKARIQFFLGCNMAGYFKNVQPPCRLPEPPSNTSTSTDAPGIRRRPWPR